MRRPLPRKGRDKRAGVVEREPAPPPRSVPARSDADLCTATCAGAIKPNTVGLLDALIRVTGAR